MRIDKSKVKQILDEELATLEGIDIAQPVPDGGTMPTSLPSTGRKHTASAGEKFLNKVADVTPIVGGVRSINRALTDPKASTGEKVARSAVAVAGEVPLFKGASLATKTVGGAAQAATAGAADKAIKALARKPPADQPVQIAAREGMKSIDLIKTLVVQQLNELNGGIMDPNMVPFVPHREPAADPPKEPEEDTEVDRLYRIAVKARLATEELVRALDDPIHDQAYDSAFKATMALRDSLNSLIDQGANPIDSERIVAPPENEQPRMDAPGYAIPFAGITYSGDNV